MYKKFMFVGVMAAAVALPYLVSSSSDWWKAASARFGQGKAGEGNAGALPAELHAATVTTGAAVGAAKPLPIEGYGAVDLAEVIQFDGSPSWVMSRWPRVIAGLAEVDLQGYRVPLVTGTAQDDLAGSLTYYFDKNQRIARISFHGTTGDPRKIIQLVTSRYSFLPTRTDDPALSLYQVQWNGKATSELRIRTARVLRADQPHSRYEVDLAMKRP